MNRDQLTIYRHRLPHWRLEGAVYFVTWRLAPGQAALTPGERDIIQAATHHFHGSRYLLFAHVVMNDHVHALVKPLGAVLLQNVVRTWKSFTSHELVKASGRASPVWQPDYFDRIMRDEDEFREKAQYILNNPWKRWPDAGDYPWVGCDWPEEGVQ